MAEPLSVILHLDDLTKGQVHVERANWPDQTKYQRVPPALRAIVDKRFPSESVLSSQLNEFNLTLGEGRPPEIISDIISREYDVLTISTPPEIVGGVLLFSLLH